MVKLTMIARVTDGLPLVEGLDDGRDMPDADFYKKQAKALFTNLSRGQNDASRMSIETGPYIFQYPFASSENCFLCRSSLPSAEVSCFMKYDGVAPCWANLCIFFGL